VAGVGAYHALSDIRYKKDIHDLADSLAKVLAIRGVSYKWGAKQSPADSKTIYWAQFRGFSMVLVSLIVQVSGKAQLAAMFVLALAVAVARKVPTPGTAV